MQAFWKHIILDLYGLPESASAFVMVLKFHDFLKKIYKVLLFL